MFVNFVGYIYIYIFIFLFWGFWVLGFRGLGFVGLGFWVLGFWVYWGLECFRALGFSDLLLCFFCLGFRGPGLSPVAQRILSGCSRV